MIYVFSDPHFYHGQPDGEPPSGIIKHANRPFAGRDAMNRALWDNINRVVTTNDLLICCGDWVYGVHREADYLRCCREARAQINCQTVWLVSGNHDRPWLPEFRAIFEGFHDFGLELRFTPDVVSRWGLPRDYEHELLVCCHYKLCTWRNKGRGSKHVYGHSHGSLEATFPIPNSRDVSVECISYTPLSVPDLWLSLKNSATQRVGA